jgi:hypothetical protein
MELHSQEESVIVHYKDNTRCAVTFFNGHADTYPLGENQMGRAQMIVFYETSKASIDQRSVGDAKLAEHPQNL